MDTEGILQLVLGPTTIVQSLEFHEGNDYLIYTRLKCVSVLKGNGPIQGCQGMYYISIILSKRKKYIFRRKEKTTTKVGQYKPQQIDIDSSDKSEDDFPNNSPLYALSIVYTFYPVFGNIEVH